MRRSGQDALILDSTTRRGGDRLTGRASGLRLRSPALAAEKGFRPAKKGVVVPSVSFTEPKLWSYADLMSLRLVDWLRHPKAASEAPASSMMQVRRALSQLQSEGIALGSASNGSHSSPFMVFAACGEDFGRRRAPRQAVC